MAAGQAVPPRCNDKISSPVKILFAIGLILLTLYGRALNSAEICLGHLSRSQTRRCASRYWCSASLFRMEEKKEI